MGAWERRFRELAAYKSAHGHCKVRESQHLRLGRWVKVQRRQKVNGTLSGERVDRLNEIDFEWQPRGPSFPGMSAESQEDDEVTWQRQFQELEHYKQRHGRFPSCPNKLAYWTNDQRRAYKKGKLSDARQRRLHSLVDFEWEPQVSAWERRFRELVAYKSAHGHCKVRESQHLPLGRWVKVQRRRKANGTLSEERLERLNVIAFEWQPGRGPSLPKTSAESREEGQEEETEGRKMNHSNPPPLATQEANGNDVEEVVAGGNEKRTL